MWYITITKSYLLDFIWQVNPIGYEVADQGREVDDINFIELNSINEKFIDHDHFPHHSFFVVDEDVFLYDVFD